MAAEAKKVPVYCYQCVAGPDLLTVRVEDGVATQIEPNFKAEAIHPGAGKVCVKAYGLVQKTYNPRRVQTPMKRTNPQKGRAHDPGFVPISWDEAFDIITDKLKDVREKGLLDESGFPRVAASFGGGGTPTSYMGTFPAFMAAWGPVDLSFGSGQGVKCVHSEHLYGELWHRGFTVCPDTPNSRYILSFGQNIESSGGVCGVYRHANARVEHHTKRVQIEPHLSVTGGCSAEWVPIKPKTDPAFMYALMHVMLYEAPRERLDIDFLRDHTASPYLVGPNGYYMRDPESRKPLLWDTQRNQAVTFDTDGIVPALEGTFAVDGIEVGPDDEIWTHTGADAETGFSKMVAHMKDYTPEWAAEICDVPVDSVRRIANEYLDHACVGETIEIDGETMPFRPVAVVLGKTVNNGWGGYECCWARTMLAVLVGALEVPGGTLGTTVRLVRPATSRQASVSQGPDGFMVYPMNPTGKDDWQEQPRIRNAYNTLVPLSASSPWSPALGPTHLAWMFQREQPENFAKTTRPDVWFVYRTNPAISQWDAPTVAETMADFPFTVCFAYTHDETNHMADVLLPECTDLEATQLIRIGGTKYQEQFWDYAGFALRQPAAERVVDSREFTDIATELCDRLGLTEKYNAAINRGAAGVPLMGEEFDFSLDPKVPHTSDEIWDASCKAASAEISGGEDVHDLDWFKENGFLVKPFSRKHWYLFPTMRERKVRFELPYQEQLLRIGHQLANRLHEKDINWWDTQLSEYSALPPWKDFPGIWEKATINTGGTLEDMPFWLVTAHSMQYSWGNNVGIPLINEVAKNVKGQNGVVVNTGKARAMGIADGDMVEITSTLRSTQGRAILRQGIRPDTLLIIGQFEHWATPDAKDLNIPSMNTVTPMMMELTDATGSSSDLVRVGLRRVSA